MKKSELEQEVLMLRQELEHLRAKTEKPRAQKKAKTPYPRIDSKTLESDIKQILSDVLKHAKKDYDNLSPATALLLFALGALFGSALAGNKGDRS